jgi:hypothetical protein
VLTLVLAVIWIAAAGAVTLPGLEFYLTPLGDRAYSSLADQWGPTGLFGQGLGIVGTGMMTLGVVGYMLRKRLPWLQSWGALRHWLQVHIFLCTLGPYFVLLHTTFKFGGVISVAFWSMAVVVVSGVFGRYVYARIPKTIHGRFLDLEAVGERSRQLLDALQERTGTAADDLRALLERDPLPARAPGMMGALALAVRSDFQGRRQKREVRQFLRTRSIPADLHNPVLAIATQRHRLERQALLLHPFQRLFRYWHVIHLPLAVTMFLILGVHVAVAVAFGYTWIF